MDQITHSNSSSSSSSSRASFNNPPMKTTKSFRRSYSDSLHSVRKQTQKPITKPFIAPLPPNPAKVYHVNSSNFKQVVRNLTSTPEFQSPPVRRLQDIAPPPLILSTKPPPSSAGGGMVDLSMLFNEPVDTNGFVSKSPVTEYFGSLSPLGLNFAPAPRFDEPFAGGLMSPLGLNLSPSSLSWCSSVLLSPANHSGFNQSPII